MAFLYPTPADLDTRVRCPSCGYIFPATEIRYLGVLTPKQMKILVFSLMAATSIGAVYWVFIDPLFSR